MPIITPKLSLLESFFKPLFDIYSKSKKQRQCKDITDLDYAMLGINRCLSQAKSGRDYIQRLLDEGSTDITVSHFFKALSSKRRLTNLSSLNDLLREQVKDKIADPYAEYKELVKWDIYAVDGHYQEHSCHDPIYTDIKGNESHAATGQFFRLNLRNHHMSLLQTMQPDVKMGKKKVHDTKIIQSSTVDQLRYEAKDGRKVMLVWDKACIDYSTWHKLKHQHGVYFITMEKSNSAAMTCSVDLCDHDDPRNEGVISVENIGVAGEMMRRIRYKNPEDDKEYTYITNDMTLPPYLLVSFYKHRWDIEKVFYQFKSKFEERKSWATSHEAKMAHATFECLLHNLLLLMEQKIEDEEGLHDEQSEKRAEKRKRPEPKGYINKIVQRASHRTLVFIRWLRNCLNSQASYTHAISRLNTLYTQEI